MKQNKSLVALAALSGGLADGGGYLSFVFSGLSDRKTRKISFRHWTERRFRGHH